MSKNIKRKTASHIYYGLNLQTGSLQHISEVPSGKRCDCICVFCKQPFEARKGNIRRHHFAHVSNYECMYASEVAIYKALANGLEVKKRIMLPQILLRFPTWLNAEVLRESREIPVDSVTFECEDLVYPPILKVGVGKHELRILLDFNYYYDEVDLAALASVAKENGDSLLLYHLPGVDDDARFTPEQLAQLVTNAQNATWVFSRLEAQWKKRYAQYAVPPEEHGSGYLCPISVGYYKGKYSARWVDCAYCKFNIAPPPSCLCTAKAGIQTPKDFSRSQTQRAADMEVIRLANEASIRERQRMAQVRFQARHTPHLSEPEPIEVLSTPGPTQQELDSAYKEIATFFDVNSTTWTIDRFKRRWIQCQICGEIKQDTQMSSYGGIDGVNRGICSACSRKRE